MLARPLARRIVAAMTSVTNRPPYSVGLGGDGDEIDAIAEVERRFGVQLDYSEAVRWRTVGDVFCALQRALPQEQSSSSETWLKFCEAISQETGVDVTEVSNATLLLGEGRFDRGILLMAFLLIGMVVAIVRNL
ncbi:hypothetical protein [Novosphingobium sp. Rr 2-17]|uniref:hypothetical protein n=1 Tax=Novosphingobium sp. Rr 2-17 TaxID=555793 RepID=UPI0012F6C10F|nr:hypothetical protein [Novosphingobium sp. Rr 2-17]